MKKVLFLFLVSLIPSFTFAQKDGDLDNQFYFRFGASMPTWKYYGADGKDDFSDDIRKGGGIFEMGSIFMLNSIRLADGMRIGINVDYLSMSYHRFKLKNTNFDDFSFFFGSKVGPSFSYSPVNKLVFDAFVKYNPVWVTGKVVDDKNMTNRSDPYVFMGFVDSKLSAGVNVRFSILMLGFEYNPGSAELLRIDDTSVEDQYYGNLDNSGKKTPMPCYNLTFGLSF
jgi:hypothetical protein